MDNFVLLTTCFLSGIFMRKARLVPENSIDTVNAVIIWIAVPAVALVQVHSLTLSAEVMAPAFMGWIVFFSGWAFFSLLGRLLGWSKQTVVCLLLTGGLGNILFIGLPLIEAYYGGQWTGLAFIMDQGGHFPAMLIGMAVATATAGKDLRKRDLLRQVVTFPPLLAVLTALVLMPVDYPVWLESALEKTGAMLTPLASFSVGLAVRFSAAKERLGPAVFGLGFKLVLAPLLVLAIYSGIFGLSGTLVKVTIFEAAMAPMVLGGIIAMQQNLDRDLAATMLGLGTPISFATTAGWFWAMERFLS